MTNSTQVALAQATEKQQVSESLSEENENAGVADNVVEKIIVDAQQDPDLYLQSSEVPEGGE